MHVEQVYHSGFPVTTRNNRVSCQCWNFWNDRLYQWSFTRKKEGCCMMVHWLHSSSLLPHPPSSQQLHVPLCGGLVRIDRSDPCLQPAGRDVCRRFLCYSLQNFCVLSAHYLYITLAYLLYTSTQWLMLH